MHYKQELLWVNCEIKFDNNSFIEELTAFIFLWSTFQEHSYVTDIKCHQGRIKIEGIFF